MISDRRDLPLQKKNTTKKNENYLYVNMLNVKLEKCMVWLVVPLDVLKKEAYVLTIIQPRFVDLKTSLIENIYKEKVKIRPFKCFQKILTYLPKHSYTSPTLCKIERKKKHDEQRQTITGELRILMPSIFSCCVWR